MRIEWHLPISKSPFACSCAPRTLPLIAPPYVHFARWKPNARRFDQPTTNREGGRRHAGPDPGIPPKAQLQVVDGHFRESMKQSMEGFQKQWGWPKGPWENAISGLHCAGCAGAPQGCPGPVAATRARCRYAPLLLSR